MDISKKNIKISIFWFRRDLRLEDNIALIKALNSGVPVVPLFIFDQNILENLSRDDPRISFIYRTLESINIRLQECGSSLLCMHGYPLEIWDKLSSENKITSVYFNRDYEPYGLNRDQQVTELLETKMVKVHTFKDHVFFEPQEVKKDDRKPYTVYTPYKRKWMNRFINVVPEPFDKLRIENFHKNKYHFPDLSELGFWQSRLEVRDYDLASITNYSSTRDFPSLDSTTYLGPYLRFGTISIREIINQLRPEDEVFLGELIWREFFMQILFHYPDVVSHNFRRKYDGIEWLNNPNDFEKWCTGNTGYPLVDAGMRQLNATGYMHNRVRMVTASFLCKHLLIDWRWGEAYFASKLLDYELSSNNGNWQWAAGTGCDAAPYFRIFSPSEQQKKFDKEFEYIKSWLPEYGTKAYPPPIIEHTFARKRAIDTYKYGLQS